MKKGCFLLGALLALSSCADGADRKFEHVQTVVNNSSVAVSFRNDQNSDVLSVGAGETKEVGFYSGNTLPVLTLDDSAHPRVSVVSQYRSPKVFEKVYTVSDLDSYRCVIYNLTEDDVTVGESAKMLGDSAGATVALRARHIDLDGSTGTPNSDRIVVETAETRLYTKNPVFTVKNSGNGSAAYSALVEEKDGVFSVYIKR